MKGEYEMPHFAERIRALGTENAFKLGEDIRRAESLGQKVIRLNLGEPDFNSADNINDRAIQEIRRGNSHYTDPQGILPFRETIARQVAETRGVKIDPRRVVVTAGAKPTIAYTLLAHVDPGDEVIYPSPGFPIYESWITFIGATPRPLHLSERKNFLFDPVDLEKLITARTKLIFLNSPSNPTGGVLTRQDLQNVADVIRNSAAPDLRIYSDEIYENILFDGRTHQSIMSLPSMTEQTIMVSGHSKTFAMTGWRLGYAILPTVEEANLFKQFNINFISCVPPFIQEAGIAALDNPENKNHVVAMVREFEKRRDCAIADLAAIPGVTCARPEGAFYAFPNIEGLCEEIGVIERFNNLSQTVRGATSPSTLFQMFLLYRYGVATLDRRSFGVIGSEGKHFLRISLATALPLLKEGIENIARAAVDRSGFSRFMDDEGPRLWPDRR